MQKLQEQQQKNQREGGAGAKKKAGPTDKEVALRRQVAELEVRRDGRAGGTISSLVRALDDMYACGLLAGVGQATVEHERTLMKRTQVSFRIRCCPSLHEPTDRMVLHGMLLLDDARRSTARRCRSW